MFLFFFFFRVRREGRGAGEICCTVQSTKHWNWLKFCGYKFEEHPRLSSKVRLEDIDDS